MALPLSIPPCQLCAPIFDAARLASGDTALIALTAVREEPDDPKVQAAQIGRQLAAQIAATEAQSYAAGARSTAKVVLNPKAID